MGRRWGGRRRASYVNWSARNDGARERLSRVFGGIDKDVLQALAAIPPSREVDLFREYAKGVGEEKARYARRTFRRWASGETKAQARTLEQLLEHLPPLLDEATKYDLVRKLRTRLRTRESVNITCSPLSWKADVLPFVENLIQRSLSSPLPAEVTDRLSWLSKGSAAVAQQLLGKAEALEALVTLRRLEEEFSCISNLLAEHPNANVRHSIHLPYGDVRIHIDPKAKVKNSMNKNYDDDEPGKALATLDPAKSLLQQSLKNLAPEEVRELSKKAAEEALSIEAERVRSDQRFENAARDIATASEQAGRLSRQGNDFQLRGSYKSASGTTDVDIKRVNQRTIIVLAVIAGIVLLIFLLKTM